MEVVVDSNSQKEGKEEVGLPIFFLYARPVGGHDVWADYFVFDCAAGMARLEKTGGVSKHVETLQLKDAPQSFYKVPEGSLMFEVMSVACHGRAATPPSWRALPLNLRRISADYYRGYLGQAF
ncbi:MAG: hypothetical protein ACRED9_13720 [Caulobacteraceae bacterium]